MVKTKSICRIYRTTHTNRFNREIRTRLIWYKCDYRYGQRMYYRVQRSKIGVTGMATPMAGAIVLFGFNSPIKSIITIAAVAVTGTILAFIIGSLIKNSTLLAH